MQWIIQNNIAGEDGYPQLLQALATMGIKHSVHQIIPFTSLLHPAPEITEDKVICMGSYSLLRAVKANNWNPGVYDLSHITHKDMFSHWGNRMLNTGSHVSFENVPLTEEFKNGEFFLRPATDEKFFVGKVLTSDEFNAWSQDIVVNKSDYGNGLTKDTPVLIASPKKIYSEFRTWIVNGKVITASSYKLFGNLHTSLPVDQEIVDYAHECANIWNPHVAYCLDVCKTSDGLFIVEPNTINFAGYYNGNMGKIIDALETLNA